MSELAEGQDVEVAWTTLDFGPITAADYDQLTAGKPPGEQMTRGERLAGALGGLRPDDAASLSLARWHAEDDPGYVYVRMGLARAAGSVYEACGLVAELEHSWTDWRIEDEWSPARRGEVHVLQWHRGMDAPLVRRGVRDDEGAVAFELGRAEYELLLESFPDDPLVREHLIGDYCYLDPALGEDLDSALLKRLRTLAKVLDRGAALRSRGHAEEEPAAQELPPLVESAATRWNEANALDYVGTGPEPFSIAVDEADALILELLADAVDSGALDAALGRAGTTRDQARHALASGDWAQYQRLVRAVVREVTFGETPGAPVRLVWK